MFWKRNFLILVEAIIVILVGVTLEFNDHEFTAQNKHIGYLVGIIGLFVVVSRHIGTVLFEDSMDQKYAQHRSNESKFQDDVLKKFKNIDEHISRISEFVDIGESVNVEGIKKILDLYLNITEPEFRKVKEVVLAEAIRSLSKMKNDKRSEELVSSEYYEWLLPILIGVGKGGTIQAVSCMHAAEWDDSPAEEIFIQENINAGRKGASVERIFLMKSELLKEALSNHAVNNHSQEKREEYGLVGYFADVDKVAKMETGLIDDIGHGFIIVNSSVALVDKFDSEGQVRGIVTMNEYDIQKYERTFKRLKLYSVPLTESLVRENPCPTTTLSNASSAAL